MKLTVENFNKESLNIVKELQNVFAAKNHDYGNSFEEVFDEIGEISAATRIYDKCKRLVALSTNGQPEVNESIEDTLKDMINYALMTLIKLKDDDCGYNAGANANTNTPEIGYNDEDHFFGEPLNIKVGNWYRVLTRNEIANGFTKSNIIGKYVFTNKDGEYVFYDCQWCTSIGNHAAGDLVGNFKHHAIIVKPEHIKYIKPYIK